MARAFNSNGKLLAAAEQAEFDAVITCDKNMQFQQNVRNRELAIVILPTNHWRTLPPHVVRIATAIDFVQRGQIAVIDIDRL
jgi:hypothetical protein